jgi:ergothioneine biosynthesis protein EgtB
MRSNVRSSARAEEERFPAEDLAGRFQEVRGGSLELARPLSPEDCALQSMPDASPVKWHLAHTSWFFETFVLEQALPGYRPFHESFRVLYNSYYNAVGEQHPRPDRGLISRPSLAEIGSYRAHVDEAMSTLLGRPEGIGAAGPVVELGLHHEQQHQELILMDVKHLLSRNPLRPAYRPAAPQTDPGGTGPLLWHAYEEGVRWIGHRREGFSFDNERPRHRQFVSAFELGSRLVTNGEFLQFVEDRGYERANLWLSDGFATAKAQGWDAPLYWERRDDAWFEFTLAGLEPLDPNRPVCHVSYYEADAFARWASARLPTEAEWETAASGLPREGNLLESGELHPLPAPAGSDDHPKQLYGDVWEWAQSPYSPYPGYQAEAGALGEYNGKFMANQFVLRGGACVTPTSHIRATYRNFFYPHMRWQFAGFRLAR